MNGHEMDSHVVSGTKSVTTFGTWKYPQYTLCRKIILNEDNLIFIKCFKIIVIWYLYIINILSFLFIKSRHFLFMSFSCQTLVFCSKNIEVWQFRMKHNNHDPIHYLEWNTMKCHEVTFSNISFCVKYIASCPLLDFCPSQDVCPGIRTDRQAVRRTDWHSQI